jgi:hypothetical protein
MQTLVGPHSDLGYMTLCVHVVDGRRFGPITRAHHVGGWRIVNARKGTCPGVIQPVSMEWISLNVWVRICNGHIHDGTWGVLKAFVYIIVFS